MGSPIKDHKPLSEQTAVGSGRYSWGPVVMLKVGLLPLISTTVPPIMGKEGLHKQLRKMPHKSWLALSADSIWRTEGSGTHHIHEPTSRQHYFPWILKNNFVFRPCDCKGRAQVAQQN